MVWIMNKVIRLIDHSVDLTQYGFKKDMFDDWQYTIYKEHNMAIYISFGSDGIMELWFDNYGANLEGTYYLDEPLDEVIEQANEHFAIDDVIDFPPIVLELFIKGVIGLEDKREAVEN